MTCYDKLIFALDTFGRQKIREFTKNLSIIHQFGESVRNLRVYPEMPQSVVTFLELEVTPSILSNTKCKSLVVEITYQFVYTMEKSTDTSPCLALLKSIEACLGNTNDFIYFYTEYLVELTRQCDFKGLGENLPYVRIKHRDYGLFVHHLVSDSNLLAIDYLIRHRLPVMVWYEGFSSVDVADEVGNPEMMSKLSTISKQVRRYSAC